VSPVGAVRWAPRRAWLGAAAPRLVTAAVPGAGAGWRTDAVTVTDTAVAVATVSRGASGLRYVVKMPCTAQGRESLRRQAAVLAALHRDDRLRGWWVVVPRPAGRGEVSGRPYWVEEALPGTPAARSVRRGRATGLLDAATMLIGELHDRTAEPSTPDAGTVATWVDAPVSRLEAFCVTRRRRRGYLPAVDRVRAELRQALAGRCIRTCWIHGDFWPGNLLVEGPALTGVVDWDRATGSGLALHDLLHLRVLGRRLVTGEELGDVVVHALRDGPASALGVPADRLDRWLGGLPARPAMLLYWLRHVSLFIDSEGHRDNPRWLRGNIEHVLAVA
jgi:aminoglycoside phosphotransferase (APT) family kinase protein